MSILVDAQTRLLVQGITGRQGRFHAEQMLEYGTQVVAGVTPGKSGSTVQNVAVFDTVADAVAATGANASIVFVPPSVAADSLYEAIDSKLSPIICISEGIPVLDMIRIKHHASTAGVRLIGPNCPGIITPGQSKVGIMPGAIHEPGSIGVISRSGTLTYEAVYQLTQHGLGQSTVVGIGGDPVKGMDFVDVLQMFESDSQTHAVVMIGEIGGNSEQMAAAWIAKNMTKPVVAYIAGKSAPPGRRMGHAGAIITGAGATAEAKITALQNQGIRMVSSLDRIGQTMFDLLRARGTV
ncbi:MAG: succinate--CoA ligase subunit alpha [Clostridiales bacterium]|nr:succinate--CoA ligase subunit alpha [Clostridiales bacterium]